MLLANLPITTAVTASATTIVPITNGDFATANVQCNFTYGSGGTTWSAWVQTTLDGGNTWVDSVNFSGTTASLLKVVNLSTYAAQTTAYTPTNGTLAANTVANSGTVVGNSWRVLLTTTGTYAGSTTLRIDIMPRGPIGNLAT